MEDFKMLINFASNLILCLSFTAFIIFVFGRADGKLNQMPWYKTIAVNVGLGVCTAGALFSALTLDNPNWPQVVLNLGLATTFAWAAYFHYVEFVCVKEKPKTKRKTKVTKYK